MDPRAWKTLPDVWALIKPRRALLLFGLLLMAINRVPDLSSRPPQNTAWTTSY